ncbi:acetyl-CoA sensor PanZ family protein [Spartinivicinus poritis]|uniref:Acetyl-CoA sensor PanZ family protein n=1 Tax=Spartinivicinus poritis TaxID=2994640 RepID=A0ABT5UA69_9GAMM|nr:GNAT family N-acetyltransferase [Spartinivicinus sp. A2-2]MDE1462447.1 acetyl-CoA sensor PanZ family protein [Spartinivicinus sp. A2-2]
MPVTVEVLTNIIDQGYINQNYQDIAKSYQQAVVDSSMVDMPPEFEQFWSKWDGQATPCFYAAYFNRRIIGWAIVNKVDKSWVLEALCVGLPNHGRGVGERILQVLTKQAAEAGCQLLVDKPAIYFEKDSSKL